MGIDEKLEAFRRWAPGAIALICDLLEDPDEVPEIFRLALERHIEGHKTYGDKNLMEWDNDTLYANFLEELADAIVYGAHWLDRFSRAVEE